MTGGIKSFLNVAAASLAIPRTPKQSTRFEVISYSNTISSKPKAEIAEDPNFNP